MSTTTSFSDDPAAVNAAALAAVPGAPAGSPGAAGEGGASPGGARPFTGGQGDPEGEAPWAMQLVVRLEKTAPASRTALCEAAGVAVVRLLTDERALAGGEWGPDVERWLGGRIRKHCRRARGAGWLRAQTVPGVTVSCAGAEVRAYVPTATDAIPAEVARLQLSGGEPEDPDVRRVVDPEPGGPVVVSICPDPFLPLGKAAAAAGHAAQLSVRGMDGARLAVWAGAGYPVVVEHPEVGRWRALHAVSQVIVQDGGFTVVAPGTVTALARWA